MIAPTIGGWLLGALGARAPGLLGAALMAGSTAYARVRLIMQPEPPLVEAVAG